MSSESREHVGVQSMGTTEPDAIEVRGHDLCRDLIGKIGFGEMVFLEVMGRLPAERESRLADAVLVCLTEHGMTASAIAARLTALGSPSSVQGAIAAGVLGAGDVFLGALSDCAVLLTEIVGLAEDRGITHDAAAELVVGRVVEQGRRVPGLGHPVHKPVDPRTEVLFELTSREFPESPYVDAGQALRRAAVTAVGRDLPINADGACAVALATLGLPPELCRGFAVVARAAGVFGHLADELSHPVAGAMSDLIDRSVRYQRPVRPV